MTSSIKAFYSDYLKGQIILEFLKDGTIPTAEQVDSAFDTRTRGKSLSSPLFSIQDYKIETQEVSSASKFSEMIETIQSDLTIAYQALVEIGERSSEEIDSTLIQLKGFQNKLTGLRAKLDEKLLALRNTDGYFDTISDTFADMQYVDNELTTAAVDLKGQAVHAGFLEKKGTNRFNRIFFEEDDVKLTFLPLLKKGLKYTSEGPGTELFDCLKDTSSAWYQNLVLDEGVNPVTAHLLIELKDRTIDITKVIIEPHMTFSGGRSTIALQWSEDGVNWFLVTETGIKNLTGRTEWLCKLTNVKGLRFLITQHGAEPIDKGFRYEFGFERIEVYDSEYIIDEDTELITTTRFALDSLGNQVEFNRISLDVCETVPSGTQLSYSVAFSYKDPETGAETFELDSNNEIMFHPIDPISRGRLTAPIVLEVTPTQTYSDRGYKDFGKTIDLSSYSNPAVSPYANVTLLYPPLRTGTMESRLVVLRCLKNYNPYVSIGPKGITPRGWWKDENWYSCYMNIDPVRYAKGLDLNFGTGFIEMDDVLTNGLVHLESGLHKIRIKRENWYDIDDQKNVGGTVPTTPIGLVKNFEVQKKLFTGTGIYPGIVGSAGSVEVHDPLFPYNQKCLIEGLMYSAALNGAIRNQIPYPDARYITIAATKMKETTTYDLLVNAAKGKNLEYYAVVNVDKRKFGFQEGVGRGIAVVRADASGVAEYLMSLQVNANDTVLANLKLAEETIGIEEFQVIAKVPTVMLSGRQVATLTTANQVILQARFTTKDSKLSPVLEGYKIKLGE